MRTNGFRPHLVRSAGHLLVARPRVRHDRRVTPEVFGDEGDNERFDRPRRTTRPRTKERPSYRDAVDGFVVTVDRGRLTVRLTGDGDRRTVFAVKARHLGRKGVVVGDDVRVVGDSSGDEGSLARIVE